MSLVLILEVAISRALIDRFSPDYISKIMDFKVGVWEKESSVKKEMEKRTAENLKYV